MQYSPEQKNRIKTLCEMQVKLAGSQNKLANKIFVSPATLSNLLSGSWEKISDEMWARFAEAFGYKEDQWKVVPTANFNKITKLLNEARTYSEVYAWLSPQGSSKTETIRSFAAMYPNVSILACEEHWSKREFLTKLYRAMGRTTKGMVIGELLDEIEMSCTEMDSPLIVLDELDKVSDNLLLFFVSIYNRLHGKCGIFICCTDYLEQRVKKGIRMNKKGYAEFFSRVGGKFIKGVAASADDIKAICLANGISETDTTKVDGREVNTIIHILNESNRDLRRVARLINATKRKQKGTQEVETGHSDKH